MGKSKDDYKSKRSSPSSPRDETRTKRHRSKDDDKKHKSRKDKISHKISKRHSDKEKKSSEKRKDKGRKHDDLSKLKIQDLSNDDYFSKNNEFATWLKEERKLFFADLSSETARSLFSEFVTEWNNKELELQYYGELQLHHGQGTSGTSNSSTTYISGIHVSCLKYQVLVGVTSENCFFVLPKNEQVKGIPI